MPAIYKTIAVIGAGAMGQGIAQIAAQAGSQVKLFDKDPSASARARQSVSAQWDKLVAKGKMDAAAAAACVARLALPATLAELSDCELVIEAIVERLDIKRALFTELESIVSAQAVLVTNTSSLSVTAIAAGLKHPERFAGYHFFNPVPLMKVVEVIDGLRSAPATGDALAALAKRMGHTAVRCIDMPGFIVNHAGRGMNTEGLRVAQESVAAFADVDAIMREQAGFRMGPFELMDLTGLDVSHPVMESVYRQFYEEPRYRPSQITAVRFAGGILGRKTGEGFYRYPEGQKQVPAEAPVPAARPKSVWISRAHEAGHAAAQRLMLDLGITPEAGTKPSADALIIVTPRGLDATACVAAEGLDGRRTVALDTLYPFAATKRRTLMTTPATDLAYRDAAHGLLASDGVPVSVIRDSGGFVAQRIVACIVNIACDIAQQRIATPTDIDLAVTLGLGYPQGPLALGDTLGTNAILEVLQNLYVLYGDPRYRPSPWLLRRARLGMSLLTPDA